MYENDTQYTANAILLLDVLDTFGAPCSDNILTDLMMGPGLVNYFTYVSNLIELTNAGLVERKLDSIGTAMYSITKEGEETLRTMHYMISGGLGAGYRAYAKRHMEEAKQEMRIGATSFEDARHNIYVHLYIRDGLNCVVDLTIPALDVANADRITTRWKNDSSALYIELTKALYSI